MNHLMRYDGYTTAQRLDDILDKISKYGISSLRLDESEFLDSYKIGKEDEFHDRIKFKESEIIFEDEYFKFELDKIIYLENNTQYLGTLYVPELIYHNKKIDGRLSGKIIAYNSGQNVPDFEYVGSRVYDVFEFCTGMEYELDIFIDYVVAELYKKRGFEK